MQFSTTAKLTILKLNYFVGNPFYLIKIMRHHQYGTILRELNEKLLNGLGCFSALQIIFLFFYKKMSAKGTYPVHRG
jgi:hypothetical protein